MDESLSWRARLAKSNINIRYMDYENGKVYFDFSYRPNSDTRMKWMSTFDELGSETYSALAERLCALALALRKELER